MADTNVQNSVSQEEVSQLREQLKASTSEVQKGRERLIASTDQQLQAREVAVDSAITSVTTELAAAKSEFAAALKDQRFEDAATAQELIATATARRETLSAQKQQIEGWKGEWEGKKAELAKAPEPQPQAQVGTKTQNWIASHPKFNSDPKYHAKAMAAHYDALSNGMTAESDDYFSHINVAIGERQAEPETEDLVVETEPEEEIIVDETPAVKVAAPAPKRQTTAAAAPPSRSSAIPNGQRKGQAVRLSQGEMDAAKFSFPDEWRKNPNDAYAAYAKEKQRLINDGVNGFARN